MAEERSTPHGTVGILWVSSSIVKLTMQDLPGKNAFSEQLANDLSAAFAKLQADDRCKVIVLTGCDNYFSSGGTRSALLNIAAGQARCTDLQIHRAPLDCKVPVIAAMQGHAFGAGLVLGLCADIVILSRESVYAANFMKFGFTPGVGSTCVVPNKLGLTLGHEMLWAARSYRGAELADRGVPLAVLPRREVVSHALEIAGELAQMPRVSLLLLKEHLVQALRAAVSEAIERELAMHEISFRQPDVKQRIADSFA